MKTVTYEQFLTFKPCWLYDTNTEKQLQEIGSRKAEWTAIDVLNLDEVSEVSRLWAVLREEFIDAQILHEFACRCAEQALSLIDNSDPRSIKAIAVKRKWIAGKATDRALSAAERAAWYAAERTVHSAATWNDTWPDMEAATWNAREAAMEAVNTNARKAARRAAKYAAYTAWHIAMDAVDAAIAWEKERQWQIYFLKKLLTEGCTKNDN